MDIFSGGILYMGIIQHLENIFLHIDINFPLDQTNGFTINHQFLHKMKNEKKTVYH